MFVRIKAKEMHHNNSVISLIVCSMQVIQRSVVMTEHNCQPTVIAVDGSSALAQRRRPLVTVMRYCEIIGYNGLSLRNVGTLCQSTWRCILEDSNKQTCGSSVLLVLIQTGFSRASCY